MVLWIDRIIPSLCVEFRLGTHVLTLRPVLQGVSVNVNSQYETDTTVFEFHKTCHGWTWPTSFHSANGTVSLLSRILAHATLFFHSSAHNSAFCASAGRGISSNPHANAFPLASEKLLFLSRTSFNTFLAASSALVKFVLINLLSGTGRCMRSGST